MDAVDKIPILVSCDWLAQQLDQTSIRALDASPSIRILDASWRLPGTSDHNAHTDYLKRHIAGAEFFDIDAIADQTNQLPHMAPSKARFVDAMSDFGIHPEDHVVVYDDAGIFSAPRVWWTLRAMGHQKVSVLDGGLPKWQENNLPLTDKITKWPTSKYTLKDEQTVLRPASFVSSRTVFDALDSDVKILDARPKARFEGSAPEPRPSLRRGHMPGALNIPFSTLLKEDKTLKSITTLTKIFDALNITPNTPLITTCGSGISAAIINLAIEQLGYQHHGLYDGAWAEWGAERGAESDPVSDTHETEDDLFPVVTNI